MPKGVYQRETKAKHSASRVKAPAPIEPMEMQIGDPEDIVLPSTGGIARAATINEQVADSLSPNAHQAALAFNEEKLTIMIHESTDPNAEKVIQIGINGRMVYLERGVQYRISRKYVERLARAKTHGIQTAETRDLEGNRATKIIRSSALAYPFSVIEDRNPNGAEWLRSILAQH